MSMLKEEKQGVPPQEKLEIKLATVPSHKIEEGVVFYDINVESPYNSWSCKKRYSQFEELQTTLLQSELAKKFPAGCELPPKRFKIFVSHLSPAFIEERRVLLEAFLKKIVGQKDIAVSSILVKFLTTDKQEVKAESKKVVELPEDVEITGVSIPTSRTMSDHVLYQIDVTNNRKRKTYAKWTVLKRFTQFFDMDTAVRAAFADKPEILEMLPPPPERKTKLFNDHMDDVFIEQRRVILDNYLNKMLQCAEVVRNKDFLSFLGVNI